MNDFNELRNRLRRFAAQRNWKPYHSPKNLAMALAVEAAEILEHFQWMSTDETENLTDEQRVRVRREIADVLIYLVQLADRLDVDLSEAAYEKISLNAIKYPAYQTELFNEK
jgi:dCTP diphosphatase